MIGYGCIMALQMELALADLSRTIFLKDRGQLKNGQEGWRTSKCIHFPRGCNIPFALQFLYGGRLPTQCSCLGPGHPEDAILGQLLPPPDRIPANLASLKRWSPVQNVEQWVTYQETGETRSFRVWLLLWESSSVFH